MSTVCSMREATRTTQIKKFISLSTRSQLVGVDPNYLSIYRAYMNKRVCSITLSLSFSLSLHRSFYVRLVLSHSNALTLV